MSFSGFPLNVVEVGLALFPDRRYDICRWFVLQMVVVDSKLWFLGGVQTLFTRWKEPVLEINNAMLWVDISKPFTLTEFIPNVIQPGHTYPTTEQGLAFTLRPDDTKFYVFGGEYSRFNFSSEWYQDPPVSDYADLWSFDTITETWSKESTIGTNVLRISSGSAAVDHTKGTFYYLHGEQNRDTTYELRKMADEISDMKRQRSVPGFLKLNENLEWSNSTNYPDRPAVVRGFMEYLPLGDDGILIRFGGRKRVTGARELASMRTIYIYDITSDKWHKQESSGTSSSGGIPDGRDFGCSVVTIAPDKSSYNIYMFGGEGSQVGDFKDDIWILSIPTFTWTRVETGEKRIGIAGHQCSAVGRYMFAAGYHTGKDDCEELFQIFDLSDLWWSVSFDPSHEYEVPDLLSRFIGGGNTRKPVEKTARAGWSSPEVEKIFAAAPPTSPGGSRSTPSPQAYNDTQSSKLGGGAIAGIVVGILIGFAFLVWFVFRRRRNTANLKVKEEATAEELAVEKDGKEFLPASELEGKACPKQGEKSISKNEAHELDGMRVGASEPID